MLFNSSGITEIASVYIVFAGGCIMSYLLVLLFRKIAGGRN